MSGELILSLVATVLAVASGVYGWRQSKADTSKLYTEAAANLIRPLKNRVCELETKAADLASQNIILEAKLDGERTARRKVETAFQKLKTDHESQRLAHEGVLELLTRKTEEQDMKIEKLKAENAELRRGVRLLVNQLKEANIAPRWEPDGE